MKLVFLISLLMTNFAYAQQIIHGGESFVYLDDAKQIKNGQEWFAVVGTKDLNFIVKKTKIKAWEDPDAGEARRLKTKSEINAPFLLRDMPDVKEGVVKFSKVESGSLELGDQLTLDGGAIIYKTGEVAKDENGKYKPRNTKYFTRIAGKIHKLNLPDNEQLPSPMKIAWQGDLNADGFPDFIIINSSYGEGDPGTDLYMSKKNGETWDLIKTARFPYQGC